MSEISLYIDSHLVGKRAKRIFSRRMWMVFGFGLNHTSESTVRAKYTIYLPSFLAAIHYYVAFPLADILFITKDPLLVPQESHNVDVHPECSVMDIHRVYVLNLFPPDLLSSLNNNVFHCLIYLFSNCFVTEHNKFIVIWLRLSSNIFFLSPPPLYNIKIQTHWMICCGHRKTNLFVAPSPDAYCKSSK
jgi:hypothetical protein